MKVTVKTQHIYQIASAKPHLYAYINTLAILQANGRLPIVKGQPGELTYAGIDNRQVPVSLFLQYFTEPLVQVDDYPLFIYAPKSILQEEIWMGLPDRTLVHVDPETDEETETVKKFEAWGVGKSFTNPIYENDTHVILRTNINGQFLPNSAIQVLIDKNGIGGIDIMGMEEMIARAEFEFQAAEEAAGPGL